METTSKDRETPYKKAINKNNDLHVSQLQDGFLMSKASFKNKTFFAQNERFHVTVYPPLF